MTRLAIAVQPRWASVWVHRWWPSRATFTFGLFWPVDVGSLVLVKEFAPKARGRSL